MKKLNIGMVGYGFMGRAHANAFRKVGNFFDLDYQPVLKAACGRDADKARAFAAQWGFESVETDWRKLIARDDIDLIDIAAPNDVHAPIAIAAAKAGKMVLCEKPLAMNAAEARKMVAAVEKAKVPNMVWYNYRRVPAVMLAKQLIDEGKLGRIFHYRAKFLQDWTISKDLPQGGAGLWRLDAKVAGSGVTGDLLAHCIDTALWLNGPMDKVTAMTETFIKERKHNSDRQGRDGRHRRREPVPGPLRQRLAGQLRGHPLRPRPQGALHLRDQRRTRLDQSGTCTTCTGLQYFDHRDEGRLRGWRSIHVTDSDHPYMDKWWVPGLQIGYEHSFVHQVADFIQGLQSGKPAGPDLPRRPRHRLRHRRRAEIRQEPAVGKRCKTLDPMSLTS